MWRGLRSRRRQDLRREHPSDLRFNREVPDDRYRLSVRVQRRCVLWILRPRKQELLWQRPADVQCRRFVGNPSRLWQPGLLQQCLHRRLCSQLYGMLGDDPPDLHRPGDLAERKYHQGTLRRGVHSKYRKDLQWQHPADLQLIRNVASVGHGLSVLLQ